MLFEAVIGQAQPKALFRQMVRADRLPHALLLLAAPGSGGLALALALAQFLLCEHPTEKEEACGTCTHCRKAAKLIHPDLHFSFPTVGTNVISDNLLPKWRTAIAENPYLEINDWLQHIEADNKQGNINKEECLSIIRKLSLKSFESPRKIMVLWLPEYLGIEGNRLLKLIEEPPDQTVFLLVAENQELILNTILSRCQLVKINALSDEEVTAGLMDRKGLDESSAQAIAQLAVGNFNDALKMASQEENDQALRFLEWMRCCYKGLPLEMSGWVDNFAGLGRENQKHFLRYALHFWREFLVLKTIGEAAVRLREREKQTAIGMAKVVGMEQLAAIVRLLDDCSLHVERNAHPKILFLDTSIQIHHIIKNWSFYQQQQQARKALGVAS
jgi:DNA polymerase III subunit delta'